jgi:hypothetical protein
VSSELKTSLCLGALFVGTLFGVLLHGVAEALVPAGLCLLVATIVLVRGAALPRVGNAKTLCVLFFCLATAHIFGGFLLAGLTTEHTSILSNAGVFYANAMFINCVGLFAAALGYAWKLEGRAPGFLQNISAAVDPNIAENWFRLISLAGTALMIFVYWRLGFVDYLVAPSKWPYLRYITGDLVGGTARDEWFANRALDMLTIALPFLIFRAVRRPGVFRILLVVAGYAALLLPLRRANLLGVILVALILIGIERRNAYRFTVKVVASVAIVYVLSQFIFLLGVFGHDASPRQALVVSSTALPEVRDLAWTLNLLDGETLNGVTFAQALIPLPSIASDWSSNHSLRAVSTKLIGADQTGETGGLRLTIMGEGYINFGYLGAIAVSFLWGCAVGWCEQLFSAARKNDIEFLNYASVTCFIWICFFLYLAGTQAAASIKTGALLVLGVAMASRYRSRVAQLQPEVQL